MSNRLATSEVEVAIVGGGVIGSSIAYHLGKLGISDVALFERNQVTSGTTWHAAGMVTQLRGTRKMTELASYTLDLFKSILEEETGQQTGFKQSGSIRVATSAARLEEVLRSASMARNFGLPAEHLGPEEIKERWGLINTDDLLGGVWFPGDGQVNPTDVTMAYVQGARSRGVRVYENMAVNRILVENGKAVGVETSEGVVRARSVVICGGMWSRDFAAKIDVAMPLQAVEHFYAVTEPIEGLPSDMPQVTSPDDWMYMKEDTGKMLFGMIEPNAMPWGQDGIPDDFSFGTLPENLDHFLPYMELAVARLPILENAGIRIFFNGPESFTPDRRFLLGAAPEVRGLYLTGGFSGIGIMSSGGVGMSLAQWIADGEPPANFSDVDIRRIHPAQRNKNYLVTRTPEAVGAVFDVNWPHKQWKTARNIRRSPIHDQLLADGAVMAETACYEYPAFFARGEETREWTYSLGHQSWFGSVAREVASSSEGVAFSDLSSQAKFIVEGRDACRVLNTICSADIDVEVGRMVRSLWLNSKGGIEADVTVTRLDLNRFLVMSGVATHVRNNVWLTRNIPDDAHCFVHDASAGFACFGVLGPGSRALLKDALGRFAPDVDFPNATSREVEFGMTMARITVSGNTGALGWQVLVSADMARCAYEWLREAGAGHDLTSIGAFASDSMRFENGHRRWGAELNSEIAPAEAGLGYLAALGKATSFIGSEKLRENEGKVLTRRLVQVQLMDGGALLLHGGEPIWLGETRTGAVVAGAYGHRIGKPLGMAYLSSAGGVSDELVSQEGFEVEVASRRYKLEVQLQPWLAG